MKPKSFCSHHSIGPHGHLLLWLAVVMVAGSWVAATIPTRLELEGRNRLEDNLRKLKRDSRAKVTTLELDSQESFIPPLSYHHSVVHPAAPPSHSSHNTASLDSDYGRDSAKNNYGKQAADWSLYDQGNYGQYDKQNDKAWSDSGHDAYSKYGKHDSYGDRYGSHGSGQGSGYYSRDRGYGYEKHYSYDKEVASKHHSDNHNQYGSKHGLHDHHGAQSSHGHAHYGHDRNGQLSRYGGLLYGKRAGSLGLHHDYGQDHQHQRLYQHQPISMPPTHHVPMAYPHYSSSGSNLGVPTYRSTYTTSEDHYPQQQQVDYPNDSNYASIHPGSYLNYY